ncbi:hypothetical protein FKK32_29840, partial [Klebsiella pneumoniae]|nr:hypothetical protein [Klebsiella pneumoniae]
PERFGFGLEVQPGSIWVHAVSLGETRAAAPLIERLRQERPGMRLLLTHTTATGREAGQALLRPGDVQRWLPFDTPGAVRRFLQATRPSVGVLMETEIWPNLQHAAAQAGVPMVLANARLSARSLRRGERFQWLLAPAARTLRLIGQTRGQAFYQGEIAAAVEAFARDCGGAMTAADFAAYRPEWVQTLAMDYAGHTLHEIPPSGQG